MVLTQRQTKALDFLEDNQSVEILYGGGAGGGKSILGCYWILKSALKYEGSRYLIARNRLKTLKETTLKSFWSVVKIQGLNFDMFNYNPQQGIIKILDNGSEIILKQLEYKPSDPDFDELGSLEITGVFVDECNQITEKAWNILRSRIRFRLDDFGLLPKMLGTCNPSKGFIYSRFYKPYKDGELIQERKFVESLVTDNPFISKHYKKSLSKLDEKSKKRLLLGSWEFDTDPSQLISYEDIINVFTNYSVEKGQAFITADIARFGDDFTVICLWNGLRLEKIFRFAKSSVSFTADKILEISKTNNVSLSKIICDEDGVGGGVVDILRCKGFVNNSKALEIGGIKQNFRNLKSQCYFKLAELISSGKVFINERNPEIKAMIIEELEQVKAVDTLGESSLEILPKIRVKEIIGRSPDISDALAMRMFFELKSSNKNENISKYFF